MAYTVDSISIADIGKTHLHQLVAYIRRRDQDGWYYGNKKQFEKRHKDLLSVANNIEKIANDPDARFIKRSNNEI